MLNFLHKIFFNPKTNRQGQHVSEYTLLVVSIMIGVMVSGPYVIRSWNALLKAYDDDVMDSFTDPLKPAPSEGGLCTCDDLTPGECGVTYANETCTEFERMWFRNCNPIGCNVLNNIDIAECRPDPRCCPWQNVGCAANGCSEGTMAQIKPCTLERRCKPDPNCQVCTGIYVSGFDWKERLCTDDKINVVPAPQPFVRVDTCHDNVKCEIQCQLPYVPSADATQCVCPPGLVDVCVPQPPDPLDTSGCCTPSISCKFLSFKRQSDFDLPENTCSAQFPGTNLFVEYYEADDNSNTRSYVRICCPFQSDCFALATVAGPPIGRTPHPYATCPSGIETFKMCTGNCNWDDSKVVICCNSGFSSYAACWDINGEEYQKRRCGAGSTVIAESCTGGNCSSDESWVAMCCGSAAPECTGSLTSGTYEICSNMNSFSGNDGERFSNEALQADTPWTTINSWQKCTLEKRNQSDDVDHKCEVRCLPGFHSNATQDNCEPD